MTTAIIVDKKSEKAKTEDIIEIDLSDLESYRNFRHGIEFVNFPSKRIADKTILEWFAIENISYYWFAAPILHPKYNDAVLFINRFSSFLEKNSINLIKLQGAFEKVDLIKQISNQKNIKLEISNTYFQYQIKNRIKKIVKKRFYKKIMNKKIKKRNLVFNKLNHSIKKIDNPIIITAPDIYRRETYDFNSKTSKTEEFFIKPFLDIVEKNNTSHLFFDLDYTLKGTVNTLEERLKTNFNWMPIEYLLQEKKSKQTLKIISTLKKSITILLKKGNKDLLIYKKISLTEYLKPSFEDLFLEPNFPTYIHLIELLENYLRKIKPKSIIQVYETGTYAKAFEISAKKLGIKTLAIQHGLIPTDFPEYICKEIRDNNFPLGNFIPSKTLVYGEYYKKILTEIGTYPKEKVEVIGNPTYYNFEKIRNSLDKEKIKKSYGLKTEKIILVPLSMRFFYVENSPDRVLLNTLFEGFKHQDNVKVLIRPHPGDKLDQELLKNIFPGNNFLISKNSLFEDIFMCDIVTVLPLSSVSTEVPIFEKPLLLVNIEKDNSINAIDDVYLQLVKYNVAKLIPASQLMSTINSIEKEELWKNSDSEKRQEFLQHYYNYGKIVNFFNFI